MTENEKAKRKQIVKHYLIYEKERSRVLDGIKDDTRVLKELGIELNLNNIKK